jgi:hypothetical protein
MFVATGGMNVRWSEVADPTNGFVAATGLWPTANAVTVGSGAADNAGERIIAGHPTPDGLAVFTNRASYLIYDSDDGFNTVVDANGGLTDRRSLASHDGHLYGLNERGIWKSNGRLPAEYLTDRVRPFFDEGSGWKSSCDQYAIGWHPPVGMIHDGSYWVTITPRSHPFMPNPAPTPGGADFPRLTLEVNLSTGAVMWHTTPMNGILYVQVPSRRFGAGPFVTASPLTMCVLQSGEVREIPTDGSTSGTLQSLYVLPGVLDAAPVRLHRIRVLGTRGDLINVKPFDRLLATASPSWATPLAVREGVGSLTLSQGGGGLMEARVSGVRSRGVGAAIMGGPARIQRIDLEVSRLSKRGQAN